MKKNDSLQTNRIPGLDLLRTVAIILVFIFHWQTKAQDPWLSWISQYGWSGVDLFFVLSGYLIASQLFKPLKARKRPSLKTFYLKRSFRVLPAYLTVVALYFFVPAWNEGIGLPPLWKFLTFTQNFSLDRSLASGFSHAWSLCVEEHFYLFLPSIVFFIFLARHKLNLKIISIVFPIFILFLGIFLRCRLWQKHISPFLENPKPTGLGDLYFKYIYYPTYNRMDSITIGVVIALVFTFTPTLVKRLEKYPNLPAGLGLLFLIVGCWVTTDRNSVYAVAFGFPIFALGFGGLVSSALISRSLLNQANMPGTAFLATLAYTFYLTHKEIMHLAYPILKSHNFFSNEFAMILALFVLSLVGAFVLHFLIEKPFLILRNKILLNGLNTEQKI